MGWRRVRWCGIAALAALLIGPIATAKAEISPPSAPESANELRQKALKASEAGRHEEAVRLLRAAWELRKNYFDICVLATIQLQHHQWRNAAESYTLCKKALPDTDRITYKENHDRDLKKARAHVGTITVTANVPGAEVLLDSKIIGKIPLEHPIFVDPGWYAIEVRAPGHISVGTAQNMMAGQSKVWDVQLEPLKVDAAKATEEPAPPAPKTAPVPPISAPIGHSSPSASPAPSVSSGLRGYSQGETASELGPRRVAGMTLGFVGFGLAAPSFVAALVAQIQANDLTENLDGAGYGYSCSEPIVPSLCKDIAGLNATSRAFMIVGLGGLVMSAGGLALVTHDILWPSSPNKKGSAQGAIVVVPGGGALRIYGEF
ncbi:MAG: PEGA domain-containing protein [Polyangiaceae bacterium]|nr:PEGA domain-containing protein [Polyangiaceae bacterium]